jgi:CheY-like chemotaxis protein
MPVMDGFEFIRKVRNDAILKNICIIASSASVFEAEQCASIAAGADEFLPKPISADSLLDMIRSHLELDWIYEPDNTTKVLTNEQASPGSNGEQESQSMIVPPAYTLERIYYHAKKGDLDSILEEANQLNDLDVKFKPFTQELCSLAESFQVKQLQQFIQQYVGAEV